MKIRIPTRLVIPLTLLILAVIILLLISPYIAYTRQATTSFNHAHAIWTQRNTGTYTIVVVSNTRLQPVEGRNRIKVQQGKIVAADNPNCPECSIEMFTSLTVESLFTRIQKECLTDFPVQFCGVTYDQDLGYPRRIDTYPGIRDGQERPSITVESLVLDDTH